MNWKKMMIHALAGLILVGFAAGAEAAKNSKEFLIMDQAFKIEDCLVYVKWNAKSEWQDYNGMNLIGWGPTRIEKGKDGKFKLVFNCQINNCEGFAKDFTHGGFKSPPESIKNIFNTHIEICNATRLTEERRESKETERHNAMCESNKYSCEASCESIDKTSTKHWSCIDICKDGYYRCRR